METHLKFYNMVPSWNHPDELFLIYDGIKSWGSQYSVCVCYLNYYTLVCILSSPVLFSSPFAQLCKLPEEILELLLSANNNSYFSHINISSRFYTMFGTSYAKKNLFCTQMFFHFVLQEGDKRQLRETSIHPPSSERYVHTFRDLSNFSGTINVTYRYLAGTPLNRKSKFSFCLKSNSTLDVFYERKGLRIIHSLNMSWE